jgi:glycosyltransferase involved in cell wall biosynthesis
MRIVVAHNYYGSENPSGENNAVDFEIGMLRRYGHDVTTFNRHSDEIRSRRWTGAIRGGLAVAWNPFEASRFRKVVSAAKPDVVHVHNTFPLISPSIFWALGNGAAAVLTLHNYRLFCAAAMLMRDGQPCTKCLDESSVLSGLRFGCYRNSRIATLPLANSIALHRAIGTWQKKVNAFIAFTEFQRQKLVAAGLPASRLHVKPHAVSGMPQPVSWDLRDDSVVYVGRLTPEKGVEHLIRAWIELGDDAPRLRIVGDGPLRPFLTQLVAEGRARNVTFLGTVAPNLAVEEISRAKLVIIPSTGFEGFPLVLLDALAWGTPCAVSNLGSLPTIVEHGGNGLVFEPGDFRAISKLIRLVWRDTEQLKRLSVGARKTFAEQYTEEINHRRLMDIYSAAIGGRAG